VRPKTGNIGIGQSKQAKMKKIFRISSTTQKFVAQSLNVRNSVDISHRNVSSKLSGIRKSNMNEIYTAKINKMQMNIKK
jgi:hypothetical protein